MNPKNCLADAAIVPVLLLTLVATQPARSQLLWTCGLDDNGWAAAGFGGPGANFVQENGVINALPGSPFSTSVPGGADNDYYFAGRYYTVIAGNGTYEPVGLVGLDEEAAERAFAGDDLDLRYHFNLPDTMSPTDLLSVTFDAFNLDTSGTDPRFGIEVYVNGVMVQPQIVIRPAQIDADYTTPPFTLASVNAEVGPGADNIVSLRGTSYNSGGGGNWMGIDYVQLAAAKPIPPPVLPWSVGLNDNGWAVGNGGGPSATFVQESGTANPLPGDPRSPEVNAQADDDYYLAGFYNTVIPANGNYQPVGQVPENEEAAERAFAGFDNDLRYHFNLPTTLNLTDRVQVTFDALNLHTEGQADPRYGIEIYFNHVLVQPEIVIRPEQLGQDFSTPPFTLASVNAQIGPGPDNIVSLRGVNYNAAGGGNWMGIDYVQLHAELRFTGSTVSNGRLTLTWTGTGNLQWAPAVNGPWTPVTPASVSPYTEEVVLSQTGHFYRLGRP